MEFDIEHARSLIKETVKETFLTLGADLSKEGEIKELQQDFAFMRTARSTVHAIRISAYTAVATAITTGIAAAVWHAISLAKASTGG